MWFLFGGGHLFVVSLYGGGKYFKEKALILSIFDGCNFFCKKNRKIATFQSRLTAVQQSSEMGKQKGIVKILTGSSLCCIYFKVNFKK